MYSLRITCAPEEKDWLCFQFWEAQTMGIEERFHEDRVILVASFATNDSQTQLLQQFSNFAPSWQSVDVTDWAERTRAAWPLRKLGTKLALAPPWSQEKTPFGRVRLVHNPGLACGTGEHPCTQLALLALERWVTPQSHVADIGAGSGILAIGAALLGAISAIGLDIDVAALDAAKENFSLNGLNALLVAGSIHCIQAHVADITVANISATVLLSMLEDLVRITRPGGRLILTGFAQDELAVFEQAFPASEITGLDEWRCVSAISS